MSQLQHEEHSTIVVEPGEYAVAAAKALRETPYEPARVAEVFTAYLARCRKEDVSLSTLPPGRFLMPGDFKGSPLLAFAPLDIAPGTEFPKGSLAALMERRYEAYVSTIVKPFFYGHFARLDRQIVLVDALTALNAGASAVKDLQHALADILSCFRQGQNSLLSNLFGRRIDKVLATLNVKEKR